jgi:hypothetical protein
MRETKSGTGKRQDIRCIPRRKKVRKTKSKHNDKEADGDEVREEGKEVSDCEGNEDHGDDMDVQDGEDVEKVRAVLWILIFLSQI